MYVRTYDGQKKSGQNSSRRHGDSILSSFAWLWRILLFILL